MHHFEWPNMQTYVIFPHFTGAAAINFLESRKSPGELSEPRRSQRELWTETETSTVIVLVVIFNTIVNSVIVLVAT